MVYLVGVLAAVSLGLGWVVQQRVAAHAALSELLSIRLLLHLMGKPVWWLGIAAMAAGQGLGALALQLGSVALIEPLLTTNLVFAFVFAALLSHERTRAMEVGGAALVCAALGVFLEVGNPHSSGHIRPGVVATASSIAAVAAVTALLVAIARRRSLPVESVLVASAAGVLYGLQDVATKATLITGDRGGLAAVLTAPWPYLVLGAAALGILLTQSAFRAGRLDYSLPPIAATEPIVAVALAVAVLDDDIAASVVALLIESICVVAMIVGAVLIGRSATLSGAPRVTARER